MSAIGVVLAGGAASRLPNKPLLPMKDLRPVLFSSIDLFKRSHIDDVTIIVPPGSLIPDIIRAHYQHDLNFVMQPDLTGVPHAARLAVEQRKLPDDTMVVVTMCDNIFAFNERIQPLPNSAVVRRITDFRSQHLAKKCNGHWVASSPSPYCFAGWMTTDIGRLKKVEPNTTTLDFLNSNAMTGQEIQTGGWWDIGVLETYTAYWRANHTA